MPPERGNSAASSAYVSAPHSVTAPPSTQLSRNSGTSSTRCAIAAGVRKMPLPIVEPTSTATALHRPRRRISRSPQRSAGITGADIRLANYTLTPPCLGPYSREELNFGSPGGTAHAALPFGPATHCALRPRLGLQNGQVLRPNDAARRPTIVRD